MNSSRIKVLLFLIGILLVTNLVLLLFFVLNKKEDGERASKRPSHDRSAMMRGFLKDSVGFSEQQLVQFDQIREKNREDMKPMFEEMRQSKLAFYNLLRTPGTPDSVSQAAADLMAEKQKAVDMAFYKNFENIRALCTPEQQAKYDTLVQQIVKRMISPPRRGDSKQKKEDSEKKK
jgi:periplasmic protein CpxP/Spy